MDTQRIVIFAIGGLSLITNGILLLILYLDPLKKFRTTTSYLIISLTISDFLTWGIACAYAFGNPKWCIHSRRGTSSRNAGFVFSSPETSLCRPFLEAWCAFFKCRTWNTWSSYCFRPFSFWSSKWSLCTSRLFATPNTSQNSRRIEVQSKSDDRSTPAKADGSFAVVGGGSRGDRRPAPHRNGRVGRLQDLLRSPPRSQRLHSFIELLFTGGVAQFCSQSHYLRLAPSRLLTKSVLLLQKVTASRRQQGRTVVSWFATLANFLVASSFRLLFQNSSCACKQISV